MQPHHAVHAPHVRNRALVDCLRRAAEHRAMRDCRIQHPRQPHVDRINRLGGHFVAHVEAAPRRTHELPLIRIFQLDLGGWRNFRRILGDGAECHAAAALPVGDYAPGREAFRWRHVPARRGSRDQHFPRGGAGLPQMKLRVRDRAAGARRHVAPHVLAAHILLRGSEFGADFRPLAFKLFGDEHGEAGLRALPHLGIARCGRRSKSSEPISSQTVTSEVFSAVRTGLKGTARESARPPPTALTPTRNDRRLRSSPDAITFPSASPPKRQRGRPRNRQFHSRNCPLGTYPTKAV